MQVKDTGVGISDEGKKRLFKQYGKLRENEKLSPDSLGLGLFAAKSVLKNAGGAIICSRSKPGNGTTFSFNMKAKKIHQVELGIINEDVAEQIGFVDSLGSNEKEPSMVNEEDVPMNAGVRVVRSSVRY